MRWTETEVVAEIEQVTLRRLRLWMRNGWIAPTTGAKGPRFDDLDLARIRLVCELKNEMKANDDAVAVVLSLLDQLYGIRREFKALAEAIERQPEDVRAAVRAIYRQSIER